MDIPASSRRPNGGEVQAHIVYVIGEVPNSKAGGNGQDYCFKVGVTRDTKSLRNRLGVIQDGNPRELAVLYTREFKEGGNAFRVEQATHLKFAEYAPRMLSEWLVGVHVDVVKLYINSFEEVEG